MFIPLLACLVWASPAIAQPSEQPVVIRVATFNIQDVRPSDLARDDHPRLRQIAEVIQRLGPDVILLNEIAYDQPGAPGFRPGEPEGQAGQRFADQYLAVPQGQGAAPRRYRAFMAPVNTGMPSGFDLDNDGRAVTTPPPVDAAATGAGRAYGNDCWGFGTFPGQYGMSLLVDERLVILRDEVRTFRLLPWDYMPGALLPEGADGPWFTNEEKAVFRLSSKGHWDVPVRLPNGARIHFLCSHPTPPVFDGPEKRNARRNHDEIRFWADYIDSAPYVVDDRNEPGGLDDRFPFVILGDLNADPHRGDSWQNPVGKTLFANGRVNSLVTPTSDVETPGLRPQDTATFKLRVDYVLPSRDVAILAAGVWRHPPTQAEGGGFPSDHFPVWMDLRVAAPAR